MYKSVAMMGFGNELDLFENEHPFKILIWPEVVLHVLTQFIHEGYQKVYVRDIIRVDLDDFIAMMSSTESGIAYWADEVLFACYVITESNALAQKEISGITYLDKVVFTKYASFSRTIKSATNFEIPVVNVRRSGLYSELVKWLKGLPVWED